MKPDLRFGAGSLAELPEVVAGVGAERPLVVTTRRGADLVAGLSGAAVFDGVRPHVPVDTVAAAVARAREAFADAVVGLGGGSAIDTAKAVSVAVGAPLVAVPTTYAGAEWTPFYGLRDEGRRTKAGGSGAELAGVVYDPELTLTLPRAETAGTALNALAHCAEAYYVRGTNERAQRHAFTGARALAHALPLALERPGSIYARSRLLEGALRAGRALGESGLAIGHALAQALGARLGLPHGALNAVCLPPALRFNQAVVPEAIAAFADAIQAPDAAARVERLARLGGFGRLRDLGVPEAELEAAGAAAAARPGAHANPRPVTAAEATELLRSVW